MIGLVIGHVPCALDQQRWIREARAERMAGAAAARRSRRRAGPLPPPSDPRDRGEDVWQALRF